MKTLENQYLKVTIKEEGAELSSLYNKETDSELLWQGNPDFWNRQSPILFPNVGKNYGMHYLYNGVYYDTNQHGFARDSLFALVENQDNALTMRLSSDENSKKIYPFDFNFDIHYSLNDKSLTVDWIIENKDDKTMYFTVGAHPAFNTSPEKSDYVLNFPNKEELSYHLLNTDTGCALPETYPIKLKDHILSLNNEMFEKDALIFDDGQIDEVILETKEHQKILALLSPDFPNYGIWSKPEAPFICLEPWDGRADNEGFTGEISTKEGIIALDPGEVYKKSYTIQVF